MKKWGSNMKNHKKLIIGIATLVAVAALIVSLCFQGIDLSDECSWMSSANFMFTHSESVLYFFSYYLTVLTTAVWGHFVGDTILDYRILGALVRIAAIVVCFVFLYKRLTTLPLVLGIGYGALLSLGSLLVLYGSSYTCFFYIIAVVLLLMANAPNRRALPWLAVGGFVLGVSTLVRIPNVTSVGFFLIPVAHLYLCRELTLKKMVVQLSALAAGWVLGLGVVVAIMVTLGHLEPFMVMLEMFRGIAKDGHHSIGLLIRVQAMYYFRALMYGGGAFVAILVETAVFSRLEHVLNTRVLGWLMHSALFLSAVLLAALCIIGADSYIAGYVPSGLFLVALVFALVKGPSPMKPFWFAALVLLGIAPLGSDVPFEANRCVWPFLMPLCLDAFLTKNGVVRVTMARRFSDRVFVAAFRYALLALIVSICVYLYWGGLRDCKNRIRLTEPVAIREFAGLRTTPERARALEELSAQAKKYAADEESMLVFMKLPGLYSIVGLPPFLEGVNSNLYTLRLIDAAFDKALKAHGGKLPLVVEVKSDTDYNFPFEHKTRVTEKSEQYPLFKKFLDFVQRHGYTVVWENEDFKIYKKQQETLK